MTQSIVVTQETQTISVAAPESLTLLLQQPKTNIVVTTLGPPGPEGPPGPPGPSGAGFDFTQVSPVTVWTINHNLGYRPSVQVFNVGGLEVLGEIQHTSNNQTIITFNIAMAGTARLS
jgi:hypothetical protein